MKVVFKTMKVVFKTMKFILWMFENCSENLSLNTSIFFA
jgi:hypothetical protein